MHSAAFFQSQMEAPNGGHTLPPGFRFHPTDEELIMHYLKNQAMSLPCPVSIIPEVDIYKHDPWQLPDMSGFGEKEWYFFSPRDRKYPNGLRPNRAAVSGYWKATGTDKAIYSENKYVGIKKSLVFYKGRPPKGVKTDWIMHEYRLTTDSRGAIPVRKQGSMRLDDWVLCRIYRKRHVAKTEYREEGEEEEEALQPPISLTNTPKTEYKEEEDQRHHQQQMYEFPRTFSLAHLLEFDYLGPVSHLLNDNPTSPASVDFQENNSNEKMGTSGIFGPNGFDREDTVWY